MSVEELIEQYRHRREAQRRAQARREFRSKVFRWLAITGIILLCIGIWKGQGWYREFAKRRMALHFLRAALNGDGRTLYELTAPEERERLGLTPEKAAAMVERLLALLGEVTPVQRELVLVTVPTGEAQVVDRGGVKYLITYPSTPTFPEERTWRVYWGDRRTGTSLRSWYGTHTPFPEGDSRNYLTSEILVVKLKSGLWVDFSYFIDSTCVSKWGQEKGLRIAGRILQAMGVPVKQKGG